MRFSALKYIRGIQMRKLMALAIVLVVTGVGRSSAFVGLENLSFDGSLEFGGYSAKNEVDREDGAATSDHRGEVVTRQRLGVNGDVTENVRFRVELGRHDGQFGRNIAGTAGSASSIDNETANIFFNNVYLDIVNFYAGVSARLGRQYVGNPGDMIWNISPTDDNNMSINAIDGLLLQHRNNFVHTDLFLGKLSDNDTRANTNADDSGASDTNLSSLDFVFPSLVPNARVNAGYVWGVRESTTSTRSSLSNKLATYRVGINGSALDNRLTYRAEYFMNDGENKNTMRDYKGSALDLGAGFNLAEGPAGSWGFNANWLMASGDDNTGDTKDESFRDFSALGFNSSDRLLGEIFGKSNTLSSTPLGQGLDTGTQGQGLEVFNLGFTFSPKLCPRSMFSFNWYTFNTAEDGAMSAGPNADSYGDEIDLVWNFRHSDNINAQLGYAMLSPDSAIVGTSPGVKKDDITELFTRLSVKWGGNGGGMQQIDPKN